MKIININMEEKSWKWISLLLVVMLLIGSAFVWQDFEHEQTVRDKNALGISFARLLNLVGPANIKLIQEGNDVLTSTGFPQFVRKMEMPKPPPPGAASLPQKAEPDSAKAKS